MLLEGAYRPGFKAAQKLVFEEPNGFRPWAADFGPVDLRWRHPHTDQAFKLHSNGVVANDRLFCLRRHEDGRFSLDEFYHRAHYSMAITHPPEDPTQELDGFLVREVAAHLKGTGQLDPGATARLEALPHANGDGLPPPEKAPRVAA